jgi:chromosome segregation protein
VLDEVDAPLDEANVGRFAAMVQKMKAGTQFIVITHQKPTMVAADTLYGVTMEEAGCSRLVSVQLREAEALV